MKGRIINWPPAKGPKPPHLQIDNRHIEFKGSVRSEFRFRQPPDAALERSMLLDAIGDPEVEKLGEFVKVVYPSEPNLDRSYATDFLLNHHVLTVGEMTALQARQAISGWSTRRRRFEWELKPRTVTVPITYPLSVGVRIKIPAYDYILEFGDGADESIRELSIGVVLREVALEYHRIYENHHRYKIWGHELGDLWFKRLQVKRGGKIELSVES